MGAPKRTRTRRANVATTPAATKRAAPTPIAKPRDAQSPFTISRQAQPRRVAKRATYTRNIGLLDGIKRLLTGSKADAENVVEGEVPVATPQGEDERETSTNAQTAGANDEPWPEND
jgi:hypothetical protein